MNNTLLFQKVRCSGFYKNAHDGRYVRLNKDDLTADLIDINLTGETEDEGIVEHNIDSVEKTYYEYSKANCEGVAVGFVDLVVKGFLNVVYQDACDVGVGVIPEAFYVTKTAKEVVKCAIVYYANNKKHLVPLDDISILKECEE